MNKVEVRLGANCVCDCGNNYDGIVVTRVGQENMEILLDHIKKSGEDVARQLVDQIQAVLTDTQKDEIISDFISTIDKEAVSDRKAPWAGVIGWEFHNTPCPKCKTKNIPTDHYRFFVCDACDTKNHVDFDSTAKTLSCAVCKKRYKADYKLIVGSQAL